MVIGWREKLRRLQNPAYRSTHRHFTVDRAQLDSFSAKEPTCHRNAVCLSFKHWVCDSAHLYEEAVCTRHQCHGRDECPLCVCHSVDVCHSCRHGAQYTMAEPQKHGEVAVVGRLHHGHLAHVLHCNQRHRYRSRDRSVLCKPSIYRFWVLDHLEETAEQKCSDLIGFYDDRSLHHRRTNRRSKPQRCSACAAFGSLLYDLLVGFIAFARTNRCHYERRSC